MQTKFKIQDLSQYFNFQEVKRFKGLAQLNFLEYKNLPIIGNKFVEANSS